MKQIFSLLLLVVILTGSFFTVKADTWSSNPFSEQETEATENTYYSEASDYTTPGLAPFAIDDGDEGDGPGGSTGATDNPEAWNDAVPAGEGLLLLLIMAFCFALCIQRKQNKQIKQLNLK